MTHTKQRPALFLLIIGPPVAYCWCCRACAKCMCTVYGSCPADGKAATNPVPPLSQPLHELGVAAVAEFVTSIQMGGSRNPCPPGCNLLRLFNASAFLERRISGSMLAQIIEQHEKGLPKEAVHNETARSLHGEWLRSLGLMPFSASLDQRLAFLSRLREAVQQASGAASSTDGRRGNEAHKSTGEARREKRGMRWRLLSAGTRQMK